MNKANENPKIYRAIGCMSGTAMDGIDVALIETDGYSVIHRIGFISESHDPEFRNRLRACLNKTERDEEVRAVENDFTLAHVPLILNLIDNFNLSTQDIEIIGFHGQTTHHDPDNKMTLQLGDGDLLSKETDINVAYDIRQADVAAGGQGAPLLPVYHRALAQNAGLDFPVAIINIGGVGNITWIKGEKMIAFDTGPGNAMIDDWISKHTDKTYDENGDIAAQGEASLEMIETFLSSPYFLKTHPKSLDRNDFTIPDIDGLNFEDGAATLTQMTVQSIALGVSQCPEKPTALYITGGGRHNATIMTSLADATGLPVHSADTLGWDGDAMESEGFAYMAVRTVLNEPISFPSTTGCERPTVGGIMTKAKHETEAA